MWDDNNEEVKDMCRVCLVRKLILRDIFTLSSSMGVLIADALMACAPVQIMREDGMPSLICESCYSELVRAHQFQKLVFESEKIMRKHIRKFNDNIAEYYPEESDDNTDDSYFADSFCEIKLEVLPLPFAGNDHNQNQGDFESNDRIEVTHNETADRPKSEQSRGSDEIAVESTASTSVEKNKEDFEPNIVETNEKENVIAKNEDSSTINDDADKTVHLCDVCKERVDSDCTCRNTSRRSETRRVRTCKNCDACFYNADELRKHECKSNKSFKCNTCNKKFKKKYNLTMHERSHASVKPYRCDVCGSRFSSWRNSIVHKRRHTDEKLHKCDTCKKSFTDGSSLESHKRAHKGEKPFECEFCEKSFCRIAALNRHKSTHSPEKPYVCKICKKGYSQLHYFNVHRSRHETQTTKKKLSVT